jgi:hypothetical protein
MCTRVAVRLFVRAQSTAECALFRCTRSPMCERVCVFAQIHARVCRCAYVRAVAHIRASAHLLMHMRGCVFELVCLEWPEDLAHELIWHVHFLRELAHFCRRCRPPDCKLPVMPLPLLVVRRGPVRQAVMPSPCTESIHSARAPAPARAPARPRARPHPPPHPRPRPRPHPHTQARHTRTLRAAASERTCRWRSVCQLGPSAAS